MNKIEQIVPDYIFETSWEVCNKVGGIYTVLSTKAFQLEQQHPQKVFYLGPDLWGSTCPNDFIPLEEGKLLQWAKYARKSENLSFRVGRWNIPGQPYAILVDFEPLMSQRNAIYSDVWEWFGVDSLNAYGDYHEASMFGYRVGQIIESFYKYFKLDNKKVIAHFHEWMSAFGLFYCKHFLPQVATLFTTHATSVGRSIASNGKPLYSELKNYNGDQMARELNMEAKHSAEKVAAHQAHCFTTVSHITDSECKQLLEKPADVLTPNGFEDDFVPKGVVKTRKRKIARQKLISVAQKVVGSKFSDDTTIVAISGRYEFKNKGIDLFLESMQALKQRKPECPILAYILVPAWINGPRVDLIENEVVDSDNKFTTHQLVEPQNDPILHKLYELGIKNEPDDLVKVVFVPSYLSGDDGIFNLSYYDILVGCDLTLFPSYYEPWGYTPMESAAFGIPTITTDLAGFGQWVSSQPQSIEKGIAVLHRTDYLEASLIEKLVDNLYNYSNANAIERQKIARKASTKAKQALWISFITYYQEAYSFALSRIKSSNIAKN